MWYLTKWLRYSGLCLARYFSQGYLLCGIIVQEEWNMETPDSGTVCRGMIQMKTILPQ